MARRRRRRAASAAGAENEDSTPSRALWTQDEELLLLTAWRDVLREASASGAALLNNTSVLPINIRAYHKFIDTGGSRSENSVSHKRAKLQRMYRFIVECNAMPSPPESLLSDQNESDSEASTRSSASSRAPHKVRKKLTTTMRSNRTTTARSGDNGWFSWTLAQQEAAYAARYEKSSFQVITQEMFDVLEEIQKLSEPSPTKERESTSSLSSWTTKELWLMLTAWRQVLETKNREEHTLTHIYKRFLELANEQNGDSTLPTRSMNSFASKRRRLVSLYKAISEYNKQGREMSGPHGSASAPRDWFKLSQKEKRHYLRDVKHVECRFQDVNRDFYNAIDTVMRHENMLEGDDDDGDAIALLRHAAPEVIDIDSDSSDSDSPGWEILPQHPTSTRDTRNANSMPAETSKTHVPIASPSKRMRGRVTDESSSSDNSDDDSDSSSDSSSSIQSTKHKKRKNKSDLANVAEFRLMWSRMQSEIRRERKEREATLEKIREERKNARRERKKIAKRIAQAAVEREEDKEERARQRQEWLREKERLENKLAKMRAKYKKTALELKRRAR
ncbi:hypothetical protein FI667_g17325, partial [Globisporangium splendens]